MSYNTELQSNNADLRSLLNAVNNLPVQEDISPELSTQDNLINQITDALVGKIAGGLDTSDATATANDMAEGVTAYVNGQKITGNVIDLEDTIYTITTGEVTTGATGTNPTAKLSFDLKSNAILRPTTTLQIQALLSHFGDASASDVLDGKTFTSASGLKILGTATGGSGGLPSGVTKLATGTYTPTSNQSTGVQITHNLGVVPNFCVWQLVDSDYSNAVDTSVGVAGSSFLIDMKYSSTSSTVYKTCYTIRGYNSSSATGGTTSANTSTTHFTTTMCSLLTSSTYPLKSGYTYRWVCGVMDI